MHLHKKWINKLIVKFKNIEQIKYINTYNSTKLRINQIINTNQKIDKNKKK